MSSKRSIDKTSPEQTLNNNYKKYLCCENMASVSSQDVFSWEKLCNLLDDKLKDVARKSDLLALKTDIEELKEENKRLNNDIKKLTTRLEYIDRRSRSANVVVNGLACNNIQSAKTELSTLCRDVLRVNVNIVNTRSLGAGKTFLFTLGSSMEAFNLIAAKVKLKGRQVYIQKDYTEEEKTARYNLRQLNKRIKATNKFVKVRLGEFCIFINDNKYIWSGNNLIAYSNNDAEYIKSLLTECNYIIDVRIKDDKNHSLSGYSTQTQ